MITRQGFLGWLSVGVAVFTMTATLSRDVRQFELPGMREDQGKHWMHTVEKYAEISRLKDARVS